MKRTMELISFLSFVSIVMWIILSGVVPSKNIGYKSPEKPSANLIAPSSTTILFKAGAKTSTHLSLLTPAYK